MSSFLFRSIKSGEREKSTLKSTVYLLIRQNVRGHWSNFLRKVNEGERLKMDNMSTVLVRFFNKEASGCYEIAGMSDIHWQ